MKEIASIKNTFCNFVFSLDLDEVASNRKLLKKIETFELSLISNELPTQDSIKSLHNRFKDLLNSVSSLERNRNPLIANLQEAFYA